MKLLLLFFLPIDYPMKDERLMEKEPPMHFSLSVFNFLLIRLLKMNTTELLMRQALPLQL